MLCRPAAVVPIEAVVRGYLAGLRLEGVPGDAGRSAGSRCRPGLRESDRLPEPIFTPATKAEQGEHDENIDFDDDGRRIVGARRCAERVRDDPRHRACIGYAARPSPSAAGILLADTKFEFGHRTPSTRRAAACIDEVLTPDSSRFWDAADVRARPRRRRASTSSSCATGSRPSPGTRPRPGRPCRTTSSTGRAPATSRPTSGSPAPASSATSRRMSSPHDQLPVRRQRPAEARHPRPAGPGGRGQPRPPRDRRRQRRPRRSARRADGRRGRRGGGPGDRRAAGVGAAVEPAHRGLRDRAARRDLVDSSAARARADDGRADRRRRLPGQQLRPRHASTPSSSPAPSPSSCGTSRRRSTASRRWSCPAASPTATTCGPASSPGSARSCGR